MANETAYTDLVTVAAAVDSAIVGPFFSQVVGPQLCTAYNPGLPNTRAKDLPLSGTVTASVVAEAAAATSQTLTDTKVTLTLQKAVVLFRPTYEAVNWASGADPKRLTDIGAAACAAKFDTDLFAEFLNASQSVDAGATMTVHAIQQAAYKVRAGKIPANRLASVLNHKQAYELGNDIRTSAGAFYGNPAFDASGAVNANRPRPGFVQTIFGIDLFESSNTTTNVGDHCGAVFAPQFAYAALYPEGNAPRFETSIAEQTEFASGILNVRIYMVYHVKEHVDAATVLVRSDT